MRHRKKEQGCVFRGLDARDRRARRAPRLGCDWRAARCWSWWWWLGWCCVQRRVSCVGVVGKRSTQKRRRGRKNAATTAALRPSLVSRRAATDSSATLGLQTMCTWTYGLRICGYGGTRRKPKPFSLRGNCVPFASSFTIAGWRVFGFRPKSVVRAKNTTGWAMPPCRHASSFFSQRNAFIV